MHRPSRLIIPLVGLLLGAAVGAAIGQQPVRTLTRSDVNVGGTATQLCPINGSRVDCSCTNNDGAVAIRVGDSNITATRGQRVSGGGTFKASTTGAVFGISEGAAVSVSCTDQSK